MKQSDKQRKFLKQQKKEKIMIRFVQLLIVISLVISWELLSKKGIINNFIYSSPSIIMSTIHSLFISHNLFPHILTTLKEIFIAFSIGTIIGFITAIILYLYPIIRKIVDPFLTVLNSLPKVALGPIIIIIFGANLKSIIIMAVLINVVVNITTIYNGFTIADNTKLKLFKSFKASKSQTLRYLIIPNAYNFIISSFKLNIALTLIGVITGEFLVSQKGIGYLIIYGTQVFNLNLVMSGIFLLLIISLLIYKVVSILEKILIKDYLEKK